MANPVPFIQHCISDHCQFPMSFQVPKHDRPLAPTWLCRAAGALLAAKVFYVGLVRVIRPEPSTALGLYFLGALLLFAFAGISHFVALQILEGRLLPGLGLSITLLR